MRSAIVGCGGIAQVHAKVIGGLEGAELVACADIRRERAEAMANAHGGTPYTDYLDLLSKESVDVLHILTPHALHVPMAEEAAARGIAVFMEKPPVTTRAQWRRLTALQGKVPLGVCFQNRFNPATQRLRELIGMPASGPVLGARAFVTWIRNAAYYTESGWRGTWALEGGGALINQAIHTLDLLTYLLGKPTGSQASMHNRHLQGVIEVEDTVEAYITFGTAPALFYATTTYSKDAPVQLEIQCEHATFRLEGNEICCLYKTGGEERILCDSGAGLGKTYWGNSHGVCIEAFYRSLREKDCPFPIGIGDVADTVELMLTLYEQGGLRPEEGDAR